MKHMSFNPDHGVECNGIRQSYQAFVCIQCFQAITKLLTFLTISYKHTPLMFLSHP